MLSNASLTARFRHFAKCHEVHPDFGDDLMQILKTARNKFGGDIEKTCLALCAAYEADKNKGFRWYFARNVMMAKAGTGLKGDRMQAFLKEALELWHEEQIGVDAA